MNASRRQHRLENISPKAASLLAGATAAEEILYQEGRRLFQGQSARLLAELGLEACCDGNDVAALLTSKTVAGFSRTDPADGIKWQPKQSYPGGNLHSREFHDNMALRWTGPATHTEFFFNLSPQESWKITIRLHPATPSTHAQAAALTVDGHAVALELESWPDGQPHTLTGRIPPSDHPAALRKFCLTSPVSKGDQRETVRETARSRLCPLESRRQLYLVSNRPLPMPNSNGQPCDKPPLRACFSWRI